MKLSLAMLAFGAFVVAGAVVAVGTPGPTPVEIAGSVVKLKDKSGHGSGVHIGNGYVLTANHVLPGAEKSMAYIRDDGRKGTAKVVWGSAEYDIALMKLDTYEGIAASNLECRAPVMGEAISMKGNPLILENITTWGRVAGTEISMGPWASAIPVDGAIAGGMSGGGAFDADGDLIGINVGMMIQQLGLGSSSVGISVIVPGSAICGLLAR